MSDESIAVLRRDYQRLLERLERNQRHFNRLARSAFRLQEAERRRLARELHDGLGQNLTALQHQLSVLIDGLPAEPRRTHEQAERALAICRQTLDDTRQMSRLLRPQVLDDLGLSAALHWLCRSVRESSVLEVELQIDDEPELEGELATVIFRVAQEALSNVMRHAKAQRVRVNLREQSNWICLEVEDDGCGITSETQSNSIASGSSGIGGMKERLRLYGGELQLQAGRQGGTRLRGLLPLSKDEDLE